MKVSEVVWEVFWSCREGVGMVSGRFRDGVRNFLHTIFLDWDDGSGGPSGWLDNLGIRLNSAPTGV